MLRNIKNRSSFQALTLLLLLLASGCSQQDSATPNEEFSEAEPEIVEQKVENPWPAEIRREIYGDPEIWSTPRIQFESKLPGHKFLSVWSMRPDGSDRRLVLDTLEAYETGASIGSVIRSPNNRYLAYKIAYPDPVRVGVYDLKEKKVILDYEALGRPVFMWTSDSKNLLFLANGYHYNFNTETQEVKERPSIISGQMFVLAGDNKILSIRTRELEVFNWDGTLDKTIPIKFKSSPHYIQTDFVTISPDREKLVFQFGGVDGGMVGEVEITSGNILSTTPGAILNFTQTPIYWGNKDTIGTVQSNHIFNLDPKNNTVVKNKDIESKAWGLRGFGRPSLINVITADN